MINIIYPRLSSSSKIPKNFIDFTFSALYFLISNLSDKSERSSFQLDLCEREYVIFSTVRGEFICLKPFVIFLQLLIN